MSMPYDALDAEREKRMAAAYETWSQARTNRLAADKTGTTFLIDELPCPNCGQYKVIGYLLVDENGRHQHTHYLCTFWRSGVKPDLSAATHKPCGWHGWTVPDPESPFND